MMVGRRADDPALIKFVTGLGQQVPMTSPSASRTKNVVIKKHGLELLFGCDVNNVLYPLVQKSEKTYVPYQEQVWLNPKLSGPLPFGLNFEMSSEEIAAALGEPTGQIGSGPYRRPIWDRVLDPARGVIFRVDSDVFTIQIRQAKDLTSSWEKDPYIGLLVAWLAVRGFLEPTTFSEHAALLEAASERKERGERVGRGRPHSRSMGYASRRLARHP